MTKAHLQETGTWFWFKEEKKKKEEDKNREKIIIWYGHSCYPRWWIQFTNGRKVPSVQGSGIAPALFSDCFPKKSASCLLVLARTNLQMSSMSFAHTDAKQRVKVPYPLTIQDVALKLAQAFERLFSLPLNKSYTRWNPTRSSGNGLQGGAVTPLQLLEVFIELRTELLCKNPIGYANGLMPS